VRKIVLSALRHTWLIDIDGTILKHNGYKTSSDELLPGVKQFWSQIPESDYIILLSAREGIYKNSTLQFLREHQIRFDQAIFDLPTGERIVINDKKPGGLITASAVDVNRDAGLGDLQVMCEGN
jgi:hypothetical protein